jgi:hypothetical protein
MLQDILTSMNEVADMLEREGWIDAAPEQREAAAAVENLGKALAEIAQLPWPITRAAMEELRFAVRILSADDPNAARMALAAIKALEVFLPPQAPSAIPE